MGATLLTAPPLPAADQEADGLNVLELSVAKIWGDDVSRRQVFPTSPFRTQCGKGQGPSSPSTVTAAQVWKHWLPTFLAAGSACRVKAWYW